uniref:Conotoxin Cal6.38 n=1 Tax=Californiconus californicus TaxID=1736779 RepID=O1638_CONCL|nr:RecName: Full=Conotoxin Cal6.38; AltName: Full=O1_cal6.38; Flags: Precursor [Californiconus californicus]
MKLTFVLIVAVLVLAVCNFTVADKANNAEAPEQEKRACTPNGSYCNILSGKLNCCSGWCLALICAG